MNRFIFEVLAKNFVVLLIIVMTLPLSIEFARQVKLSSDSNAVGTTLLATSIMTVTACFGIFSFSYSRTPVQSRRWRLLGHLATSLMLLVLGWSLLISALVFQIIVGDSLIITCSWVALYIGSVLYDVWDLGALCEKEGGDKSPS